jgi:hypothetical protein
MRTCTVAIYQTPRFKMPSPKLQFPAHMPPPKPSISSSFFHHTPHLMDALTGQQMVSRLQSAYTEIILIYHFL